MIKSRSFESEDTIPKDILTETGHKFAVRATAKNSTSMERKESVFLTYGDESNQKTVEKVRLFLDCNGIETHVDIHKENFRCANIPAWINANIKENSFVLICIDKDYQKHACTNKSTYEIDNVERSHSGFVFDQIQAEIIHNGTMNYRYIPILIDEARFSDLPEVFRSCTHYRWPDDHDKLLDRIFKRQKFTQGSVPLPAFRSVNSSCLVTQFEWVLRLDKINELSDSEKPESPKESNSLRVTEGSSFPEHKIDGAKSDGNDFYTNINIDKTGSTTNKSNVAKKPGNAINSNADSSQNTYNVNEKIFKKIPAIDECNAEALTARLKELLDEKLGSDHILEQLEILSSDIKEEHFKELLRGIMCQILSLSIGFNNERNEHLIPYCCQIIDKCKTPNLSLESNRLKDEDINLLQDCLVKGNEMNELNISYNEDITADGYYKLGKILIEHSVKIFRAADCDLQDDELERLINGMNDARANARTNNEDISTEGDESKSCKVCTGSYYHRILLSQDLTTSHKTTEEIVRSAQERTIGYSDEDLLSFQYTLLQELDISYSSSLTPRGFGLLANLVLKKGVKKIKQSDAQLTFEKLDKFYKVLKLGAIEDIETEQDMLLEELEMSYNSSLEPEAYKTLGMMVKICGVKRLSLAGCGVNEQHLKNLGVNTKKHKMTSVNAADNKSIGKGIVEIAKIVRESNLEELDISQCMLMDTELRSFREALGATKLRFLNLSDCDRDPNERYVEEVCQITSHVTEKLVLEWGNISPEVRDKLQNALDAVCHSTALKIALNEENKDILHQRSSDLF